MSTLTQEKASDYQLTVPLGEGFNQQVQELNIKLKQFEDVLQTDDFLAHNQVADAIRDLYHHMQLIDDADLKSRYYNLLANPIVLMSHGDFFMKAGHVDSENFAANRQFLSGVLEAVDIANDSDAILFSATHTTNEVHNGALEKRRKIETTQLLSSIARLEIDRPGAVSLLHNFYGIRAFNRYPHQVLLNQYDEHGNTQKPYGILFSAVYDPNGSLRTFPFGLADKTLQDSYNLRIIEAQSPLDFDERLEKLDELYGPKQKIQFGVAHAHGNQEALLFNTPDLANRLLKPLSGRVNAGNFTKAKDFFVKNPLFVLNSCSTGKEGGLAQKISAALEAVVIAPEEDAEVGAVIIEKTDGLKIIPSYFHYDANRGNSPKQDIIARLYIDGQVADTQAYSDYFEGSHREVSKTKKLGFFSMLQKVK